MFMYNLLETQYHETLEYLYSFIDFSRVKHSQLNNVEFDLSQITKLLALLSHPEKKYPIIHVAGTKGKGSTSSIIAKILQSAGYRVGLFTSPHLQDYCERIQISGVPVTHAQFVDIVDRMRRAISKCEKINTFAISTAIAFEYFAENKVDFAVMEVGLGGRLDATNAATPMISVITSISFDHMSVLGNTIEKIALEKAGIIKKGVPVVVGKQAYSEVYDVFKNVAALQGSEYIDSTAQFQVTPVHQDLQGQSFRVTSADGEISRLYSLSLIGYHQLENALTSYCVIDFCRKNGYSVSEEAIEQGFSSVFWPGRFEVLNHTPPVVIDCAHNPYSIQRLMETVDLLFSDRKMVLLFGASADKNVVGMLEILLPRANKIIVTHSSQPRSLLPDEGVNLISSLGYNGMAIHMVEDAVHYALRQCDEDSFILATGSVFLAAAVRNVWQTFYRKLPDFG